MPRPSQANEDGARHRSKLPPAQLEGSRGGTKSAATLPHVDFDPSALSSGDPPSASPQQQQQQSRLPTRPQYFPQQTPSDDHTTRSKLALSPETANIPKILLREAYFPNWKDDASSGDLEPPDEMQKKDPLATQIWKLYSKTKTQLPNQERMENLTWRMMAMNLKRKEREQARCVSSLGASSCACDCDP